MLTIVISTMGDGIEHLQRALSFHHPSIRYLIVHQTSEERAVPFYLRTREDVTVIQSKSRGLSRSRNIGLSNCRTSYALIADDDVAFVKRGVLQILDIIDKDKPDFGLFMIQTREGEPEYKQYPTSSYQIDHLKHWVSSVEILVSVDKLREYNIRFDERFGLGTQLGRGEEEVLIRDLIRQGLRGWYYPIYIVQHPYESSGKLKRTKAEQHFFQGAFDARVGAEHLQDEEFQNSKEYRQGREYIATSES